MEDNFFKQFLGKRIRVFLHNGHYYIGKVLGINEGVLSFRDFKDRLVYISIRHICEVSIEDDSDKL